MFVSKHYIIPVILAVVAQVILLICMKFSGRSFSEESRRKLLLTILYIPFVAAVLFLHFNFKCWTPLVNPNTYDLVYNDIDSAIPVTAWFDKLGSLIDFRGLSSYLYLNIFIFMFILYFVYHTLLDKLVNLRKVVVGTCLILLLGGMSYWIMPALGPFIFENSKLTGFTEPQQRMLQLYTSLRETRLIPAGYFTSAPAAMPSLHAANSLFFLIMAVRAKSVISVLYILIFIFILIVAVASKWHYVIDLPAGALLTFAVVFLVDRVFPESNANTGGK